MERSLSEQRWSATILRRVTQRTLSLSAARKKALSSRRSIGTGRTNRCGLHYYKNRRVFFLSTAAVWALALACNWSLIPLAGRRSVDHHSRFIVVLSSVGAITSNHRYHQLFTVLALLAAVVMLVVEGRADQL